MTGSSEVIAEPSAVNLLCPAPIRADRPLFVFLPGMDGTGTLLDPQIDALQAQFDLRSLILTPNTPHEWVHWDSLAEAIAALIEAERKKGASPTRDVYVCGESFGACLALQVALKTPNVLSHLILVNSASSFYFRPWASWAADAVGSLPETLYPVSCALFLPFLVNLNRISQSRQRILLKAMQNLGYSNVIRRIHLLQTFNLSDAQYRQIRQPTLLIASHGDRLLPSVDEAKRLSALIPMTQMHTLPHSGHACLLEPDVNLWDIMERYKFRAIPSINQI